MRIAGVSNSPPLAQVGGWKGAGRAGSRARGARKVGGQLVKTAAKGGKFRVVQGCTARHCFLYRSDWRTQRPARRRQADSHHALIAGVALTADEAGALQSFEQWSEDACVELQCIRQANARNQEQTYWTQLINESISYLLIISGSISANPRSREVTQSQLTSLFYPWVMSFISCASSLIGSGVKSSRSPSAKAKSSGLPICKSTRRYKSNS